MNEIEIAAYLDRRLPVAQRDQVEDHLAGCPDCRREILEAGHLLARARRPRRVLIGGSLLAAVAALLLMIRPIIAPQPADQLRDGGPQAGLLAYGPSGDVSRSRLMFVWSAAPGALTYRLTVTAADGAPVWIASTADTAIALADSVRLGPGKSYLWTADAVLSDGTSRSTGLRAFRPVQ